MYKILKYLILLIFSFHQIQAQKTKIHEIWAKNDSVTIEEYGYTYRHSVSKSKDTLSYGTSDNLNIIKIFNNTGDTIFLKHTNAPFEETFYVKVNSPNGFAVIQYNFWESRSNLTKEYFSKNNGKVNIELPEAFELANIAYAITKDGLQNRNRIFHEGSYYQKVITYFSPFKDHPLIKKLDADGDIYSAFRDNSICYKFKEDKLVLDLYNIVEGRAIKDNYFTQLLPLIQDFADKTRFQDFYKSHESYYQKLIEEESTKVPIKKMWTWLENEFPNRKDSYKVIFSPLINGSHRTQGFSLISNGKFSHEIVMLICGTNRYENSKLSPKQIEGQLSRIVFTEIDHNYINPKTDKLGKQVSLIFKQNKWIDSTATNRDGFNYLKTGGAKSVFNEYMTWATFTLYAHDNFSKEDFDFINKSAENLMIDGRKFVKFKEFNEKLLEIYLARKDGEKVTDMYPKILEWASSQ